MSLSRMIHKTPLSNEQSNIYEIDQFDSNLLEQIIKSRFISEGVYAIEMFNVGEYKEQYLVSPSFSKYTYHPTHKVWNLKEDVKEITIYELVLEKGMIFPLDNNQFVDIFNAISNIPQVSALTQVLVCKRSDQWRELAISMYEQFLKGRDVIQESKFVIKLQEKIVNVLTKFNNFTVSRDPVDEIEKKILQNNYRFEMRFVIFEQKYADIFVSELSKNLQKLRLFNEFSVKKVKNPRNFVKFIENREFQVNLVNQLLSEEELYSLLSSDKPNDIKNVELKKPIKHQGVVKNLEDSMLLQKAIQLMPKGEMITREIDQNKVKQLTQSFKRVGLTDKPLKVREAKQGLSLLKVQLDVPPELVFSKISKKLIDIQGALANENISIEIGSVPDTINVFLPLDKREVLYFRDVLESAEFQEFKKSNALPFILGEDVNGEYIFACLSKLRHLLIAGTSGSGKSVSLTLIILSLLLNVPPDELLLYLIDPKMVELSMFDGFPQTQDVITDMKKATSLLEKLCVEMDKRYELMAKANVKEIATYNKKMDKKLPYIVTAIDELSDLMMVNASVEDYIVRIAQKGRAAGVHLILATQRPSVDVVTGLIKANMPARIAYKTTSGVDSKTILDTVGAEKLLGLGDGLVKIEGSQKELERMQSPVLTLVKEDEDGIYKELKKLFSDIQLDNEKLPEIENDIDKLKRIIASTGELRVSDLQTKMGIAIGKVKELLTELVNEGWLKQEGKGRPYELNIDDAELNKWKDDKE